ncbi:GNAT family N-acetyltransferase [Rhodobacteraceae bacterium HSP-20]|uniref:GNAT family N-acetyltransferase n=1 Tax=Paragemmobacter amnigenus TaxID=2852097 RepID=A0ABS6J4C3_9RHOB|nr:GNAT family N-acetyltransferase [Rhodobacter amnigenus]MBU9698395.1 GNAT family N-acetyltransferase [Rhodobacter amnigenus]MBV4389622.1 GNAT family N-acetyltransferase [Rhodobacter amnigenus]
MPDLRPATKDDAATIVALMDMASHGMARALWAALVPAGQDLHAFAIARAQREAGGFSYRNTRILTEAGDPAGMVMCWPLPPDPLPAADLPATARPLVDLENLAPRGALYINAIAVFPAFRRRGFARLLLAQAGQGPQALITGSDNAPALSLYRSAGFTEQARRPAQGDIHWQPAFFHWLLLAR